MSKSFTFQCKTERPFPGEGCSCLHYRIPTVLGLNEKKNKDGSIVREFVLPMLNLEGVLLDNFNKSAEEIDKFAKSILNRTTEITNE